MRQHPKIGQYPLVSLGTIIPKAPRAIDIPAPLVGQHTKQVLTEFIGMSPAEVEELEKAGALQ